MPLLAFTSDSLNVFHIIDAMNAKGWHIQAQLKYNDYTECIHLSVNPSNVEHTEAMLRDLRAVCDQVKAPRGSKLAMAVSATFGRLNPDHLNDTLFRKMIGMAGMQGVGVPEKMADINDIMNVLPSKLSERLLIEFINRLFDQPKGADDLPAPKQPFRKPRGPRPDVGGNNGHAAHPTGLSSTALALVRGVRDRLVDLGVPLPR